MHYSRAISSLGETQGFFYVLMTVHLSIALTNDQRDAQFLYFIIDYYSPLHVSSNVVLIIRRSKRINTVPGMVSLCINTFLPPDDEHDDARNM